jgi:hypothetical protein
MAALPRQVAAGSNEDDKFGQKKVPNVPSQIGFVAGMVEFLGSAIGLVTESGVKFSECRSLNLFYPCIFRFKPSVYFTLQVIIVEGCLPCIVESHDDGAHHRNETSYYGREHRVLR